MEKINRNFFDDFFETARNKKFFFILMPRRYGRTAFLKRLQRELLQAAKNRNDDAADALTYAAQYLGVPPNENLSDLDALFPSSPPPTIPKQCDMCEHFARIIHAKPPNCWTCHADKNPVEMPTLSQFAIPSDNPNCPKINAARRTGK